MKTATQTKPSIKAAAQALQQVGWGMADLRNLRPDEICAVVFSQCVPEASEEQLHRCVLELQRCFGGETIYFDRSARVVREQPQAPHTKTQPAQQPECHRSQDGLST